MRDISYQAIVALGANLGTREETVERAIVLMSRRLGPLLKRSRLHETVALVPDELKGTAAEGLPYINAVAVFSTTLNPEQVLDLLLEIEKECGREREREEGRWRPRIIDLDLIGLGAAIVHTTKLSLPHPEMHKRSFVLEPMSEVAPDWIHPLLGVTTQELLARL